MIAGGINLGLARLNVDGSPDTTFGSGGWTGFDVQPGTDQAAAIGLQSSGKIVLVGQSNKTSPSTAGTTSDLVARFKVNGAIDSGTGGFGQTVAGKPAGYTLTSYGAKYNSYNGIAVQPDDKLVAVGYNSYSDGSSRMVVARYTDSGKLDKTFNKNGYNVYAPAGFSDVAAGGVALQSDGKIVVVGRFRFNDGSFDMFVARFKSTGQLDTTFGVGAGYVSLDVDGAASVTSEAGSGVAIQPDGKIVVAGTKWDTLAPVPASILVARLNSNGTMDSSFGIGGFKLGSPVGTEYHDFRGGAVALQSNGNIIVAGQDYWGTTGDTSHHLLMRFYGTTPSPLMAFSSNTISNERSRPSELKREALIAEVMYDLGNDQVVEHLANTRVTSQSAANVLDRAPRVDLPASETKDELAEDLLEVVTLARLTIHG